MRRLFIDALGLALLFSPAVVPNLPSSFDLLLLLGVPTLVGFGRGFAETRLLRGIPILIASIEWALIVFVSDIILCIPNSKSDPHANFWTVFGAFFIILIIPSVVLSTASFAIGFVFGEPLRRENPNNE